MTLKWVIYLVISEWLDLNQAYLAVAEVEETQECILKLADSIVSSFYEY